MKSNKNPSNYKILQGKDFLKDVKKIIKCKDKSLLSAIQRTIDGLKIDPHKKCPKMDIKIMSSKKEGVYRV